MRKPAFIAAGCAAGSDETSGCATWEDGLFRRWGSREMASGLSGVFFLFYKYGLWEIHGFMYLIGKKLFVFNFQGR